MRTIKFRAINAKDEIIYGLPYTDSVNETLYYEDFNNRLCWRNENGAHCNQPYKNGTLMQFTELHDKNGKEIYEGDIIKHKFLGVPGIAEIVYSDSEACFIAQHKDGRRLVLKPHNEVIGNIYENPEVLTSKQ